MKEAKFKVGDVVRTNTGVVGTVSAIALGEFGDDFTCETSVHLECKDAEGNSHFVWVEQDACIPAYRGYQAYQGELHEVLTEISQVRAGYQSDLHELIAEISRLRVESDAENSRLRAENEILRKRNSDQRNLLLELVECVPQLKRRHQHAARDSLATRARAFIIRDAEETKDAE